MILDHPIIVLDSLYLRVVFNNLKMILDHPIIVLDSLYLRVVEDALMQYSFRSNL
jgi:hypothetical protein